MKPSVQKILTKLTKDRVDLARKPKTIKQDAEKINDQIRKELNKIDKVFVTYNAAYREFQKYLDGLEGQTQRLDRDISDVMDAMQELGLDFTQVPELKIADDIIRKAENDIKKFRKLYPKP